MSQPSFSKPAYPVKPDEETNSMGLAGFIVSIAGLFLCGLPSVIGVLLSLVGLGKNPKGFAIGGLLIGLLGIAELVAVIFAAYGVFNLAQTATGTMKKAITEIQLAADAHEIAMQWESSGELPTEEAGQAEVAGHTDLYGNQIIYETDGSSFTLRSVGLDGVRGNEDDVTVGPFASPEEAKKISSEDFDQFDPESFEGLEDLENMDGEFSELEKKIRKRLEEQQER